VAAGVTKRIQESLHNSILKLTSLDEEIQQCQQQNLSSDKNLDSLLNEIKVT